MKVLWLCLCALALSPALAEEYAVIVAGSNGYWNYRHQADACHAYQVLINHGFDPKNIILMSYNDVPTAALNPFPGKLFNQPGNSPDVNLGCVKDYTGTSVNTVNFLAIITGNATGVTGGNGKVLKSGPDDNVFINFIDHGAPGLIAFPTTYLYADQLNTALKTMYDRKMYKKLVFYLEACESGSMFDGLLPNNTSVFATTAANPTESSWGTYCPPNAYINKTNMMTCLGDLYSINWMQNSDVADFSVETLQQQFNIVKKLTNLSHVLEYGDQAFNSETLNKFQGLGKAAPVTIPQPSDVNWVSYEVKLRFLYNLYMVEPTDANYQALAAEVQFEQQTQDNFQEISNILDPTGEDELLASTVPVANFACLRSSIAAYEGQCGTLQEYGLQYVQVLVNACEKGYSLAELNSALTDVCGSQEAELVEESGLRLHADLKQERRMIVTSA